MPNLKIRPAVKLNQLDLKASIEKDFEKPKDIKSKGDATSTTNKTKERRNSQKSCLNKQMINQRLPLMIKKVKKVLNADVDTLLQHAECP